MGQKREQRVAHSEAGTEVSPSSFARRDRTRYPRFPIRNSPSSVVACLTTSSGTRRGSRSWLSFTMVATVFSPNSSPVLDDVLQVEVLDRNVVVAVLERPAHRRKFALRIASRIASFCERSPFDRR